MNELTIIGAHVAAIDRTCSHQMVTRAVSNIFETGMPLILEEWQLPARAAI